MDCYHDDNSDNGGYSFLELMVKCLFGAQILLWIYIHKWGTLPNSEETLESRLLLYLK